MANGSYGLKDLPEESFLVDLVEWLNEVYQRTTAGSVAFTILMAIIALSQITELELSKSTVFGIFLSIWYIYDYVYANALIRSAWDNVALHATAAKDFHARTGQWPMDYWHPHNMELAPVYEHLEPEHVATFVKFYDAAAIKLDEQKVAAPFWTNIFWTIGTSLLLVLAWCLPMTAFARIGIFIPLLALRAFLSPTIAAHVPFVFTYHLYYITVAGTQAQFHRIGRTILGPIVALVVFLGRTIVTSMRCLCFIAHTHVFCRLVNIWERGHDKLRPRCCACGQRDRRWCVRFMDLSPACVRPDLYHQAPLQEFAASHGVWVQIKDVVRWHIAQWRGDYAPPTEVSY